MSDYWDPLDLVTANTQGMLPPDCSIAVTREQLELMKTAMARINPNVEADPLATAITLYGPHGNAYVHGVK